MGVKVLRTRWTPTGIGRAVSGSLLQRQHGLRFMYTQCLFMVSFPPPRKSHHTPPSPLGCYQERLVPSACGRVALAVLARLRLLKASGHAVARPVPRPLYRGLCDHIDRLAWTFSLPRWQAPRATREAAALPAFGFMESLKAVGLLESFSNSSCSHVTPYLISHSCGLSPRPLTVIVREEEGASQF